ncbi:MAG: hypothetical protein ACE5KM_08355 [Planctomycetaceae bacterium]
MMVCPVCAKTMAAEIAAAQPAEPETDVVETETETVEPKSDVVEAPAE